MSTATLITFIVYLIGMLAFGLYYYRKTNNLSDYVLGGRQLGPGVAALSAGASDMSSWLIIGLPAYAYSAGMSSLWICIGLSIGAYINWQFVAKRLRSYTEIAKDSITIPDYLENRFHDKSKALRIISALVILVFFTFYVSSGLVAGAILFEASFDMTYNDALLIGSIVIISYTFLGGFLAVSWTDFIQGILMFLALIVVPIVAISKLGGWGETVNKVGSVDPAYLDIFSGMEGMVGFLAIVSLMAWGLGYFGQPHIITRFMAIRSVKDIPKARLIGMSWMIIGLIGAVFVGFAGIAYFMDAPLANADEVFLQFADVLFNPWVSGILLAAILAAIMSTIDSQLLVSSSALAEDFHKAFLNKEASDKDLVWVGRYGVIIIALIAIILAIPQNPAYESSSSIIDLVSYAWGGFGAAFGPVILLSLFWKRMTRNGALGGMIVGAVTVVVWKKLSEVPVDGTQADAIIPFSLYEIVPGFLLATLTIWIVSLLGKKPSAEIEAEFDQAASGK
ncbi:sodium/proline symporter [Lottiidibacillus patelloidae]|uniref:Sodium/proline symporter n=1 Tax=Lottiidibacillus patelloidae TaxID=2670334 RepID=A0A263BSZ5_9BACI|nr:sodium/proline symporter PutP [Lottiidibacillus patelloidae]OZM56834.1 sodium/proline symporter [Lottiidibacillus patelloidae]